MNGFYGDLRNFVDEMAQIVGLHGKFFVDYGMRQVKEQAEKQVNRAYFLSTVNEELRTILSEYDLHNLPEKEQILKMVKDLKKRVEEQLG